MYSQALWLTTVVEFLPELLFITIVCYVIFPAFLTQFLVHFRRILSGMHAVRMQGWGQWRYESVLLAQFPLPGSVAEYVVTLHAVPPGVHAAVHVIREYAP